MKIITLRFAALSLLLAPLDALQAGDAILHAEGPVFLQDHGNPVVFRNIWIVPGRVRKTSE